jgi:predicted SprT family Zn-dependent metalloprotease
MSNENVHEWVTVYPNCASSSIGINTASKDPQTDQKTFQEDVEFVTHLIGCLKTSYLDDDPEPTLTLSATAISQDWVVTEDKVSQDRPQSNHETKDREACLKTIDSEAFSETKDLETKNINDIVLPVRKNHNQVNLKFLQSRERICLQKFKLFNEIIFENRLHSDTEIMWSNRLNSTAGRTLFYKQNGRHYAKIEMGSKIIDSKERLIGTLIHEMCHVAVWIVDKETKPPHGALFKKWADRASKIINVQIATTHSYEINYKYIYECPKCKLT